MPIHLFWDSPDQNIIRQEFSGRWTSDEYVQNVFAMYDMMRTVPHKVHIIVDMTHTEGVTTRMIAAAPRFQENLPVNRGLTVGINIPSYLVSIVHIASRIYPRLGRNVHFANTLDDAYKIIQKYAPRLH
jgi:hypothetical protein